MKIEIYSRRRLINGPLWYFRVIARNGEIIAQSEGYSRRIDCMDTAHLLKNELQHARVADAQP